MQYQNSQRLKVLFIHAKTKKQMQKYLDQIAEIVTNIERGTQQEQMLKKQLQTILLRFRYNRTTAVPTFVPTLPKAEPLPEPQPNEPEPPAVLLAQNDEETVARKPRKSKNTDANNQLQ
jgi:hypothetical protein